MPSSLLRSSSAEGGWWGRLCCCGKFEAHHTHARTGSCWAHEELRSCSCYNYHYHFIFSNEKSVFICFVANYQFISLHIFFIFIQLLFAHEPWQTQHLLFCWLFLLVFVGLPGGVLPSSIEYLSTGRRGGPAKLLCEDYALLWFLFFRLQQCVPAPLSLSSVFPPALLEKVGN